MLHQWQCSKGSHGLSRVTKGYQGLPKFTKSLRKVFLLGSFFLLHMLGSLPQTPVFPILTNHFIKLSKCRPIVQMKFGHFILMSSTLRLVLGASKKLHCSWANFKLQALKLILFSIYHRNGEQNTSIYPPSSL